MKKKLSVSLILAAAITLSGCNSASGSSSAAVSSMIESEANSAIESALAGFETGGDSAPLTSADVSRNGETTRPAETTPSAETAKVAAETTATAKAVSAETTAAARQTETLPVSDLIEAKNSFYTPLSTDHKLNWVKRADENSEDEERIIYW
ncbi:MAG: hypothetical protein IK093_19975 [Ruminiclostridium sp.]|nr:hypothetical protein [Ruminiclostridium sp.]